MSEYQYYEFQAIDRRLNEQQMDQLRACSSRAEITPVSFVNEYNWGDFKGDEDKWMERYFDAFLYFANWGTRILKFRLPAHAVPPQAPKAYGHESSLSFRRKGENICLTFCSQDESGEDVFDLEAEGLLSSLLPVRMELAQGDRRALYLGWLVAAQSGELDDDTVEPPVPPGLGRLSKALEAFVEFLRVDPDLLRVAAEGSAATPGQRRTAKALWSAAEKWREQREEADRRKAAMAEERRAKKAAATRIRQLDQLVGQESRRWSEIDQLVATRLPINYDQAVSHLADLRDLADRGDGEHQADFVSRLAALRTTHARKATLIERMDACQKGSP